jgi:predicted transcriptional regulator YdeE
MDSLEIVALPAYRLAVLPAAAAGDGEKIRRLWVDLTLKLEGGLSSAVPDIANLGVTDRRGGQALYTLGLPLTSEAPVPDGLMELETPAADFIHHAVLGSYAGIQAAAGMLEWRAERAGLRRGTVDLEVYRPPDGSGRVRTDIYLSVEAKPNG